MAGEMEVGRINVLTSRRVTSSENGHHKIQKKKKKGKISGEAFYLRNEHLYLNRIQSKIAQYLK